MTLSVTQCNIWQKIISLITYFPLDQTITRSLSPRISNKSKSDSSCCRWADYISVPGLHTLHTEAVFTNQHLQQGLDLRVGGGLRHGPTCQEKGAASHSGELYGSLQEREGFSLQVKRRRREKIHPECLFTSWFWSWPCYDSHGTSRRLQRLAIEKGWNFSTWWVSINWQ